MHYQDFEQQFQNFNDAVNLLVNILKLHDKDLVKVCEETLTKLVGRDEVSHVLNAAMFQLAETHPETCHWTWHNFPELQVCMDLKEHVVMFIVQKLIKNGFILGEDFSKNLDGDILLTPNAKVYLMIDCLPCEWKFIKSVLQVIE